MCRATLGRPFAACKSTIRSELGQGIRAMRWFWIDRFTEFVSTQRAAAIKAVSLAEEEVDEYFPGNPILSPTFVLEGFAQMGGLLISQPTDFKANTVLAKIARARVHRYPQPGDLLEHQVQIQSLQEDGGLVSASSRVHGELLAEAEMTFAYVRREVIDKDFFEPAGFLQMLRVFKLFDVAVDAEGRPLAIPAHLLEAEQAKIRRTQC
jgi:3-hydroxyacyl-[acyl-carrier-protein] dehydratase